MACRTILVHCDSGDDASTRIGIALNLAERLGSRLVGLHVRAPLTTADYPTGARMDDVLGAYGRAIAADRRKAHAAFDQCLKGSDVHSEWHSIEGKPEKVLALQARYADMTVVGQDNAAAKAFAPGLPELTAFGSGRGVLVVPSACPVKSAGTTALVCWDGSREAARAAWDALPLLEKAAKVFLLIVGGESGPDPAAQIGTDMSVWLRHHGIDSTLDRTPSPRGNVGESILAYATGHRVDLVVAGIYGHSRLRELVLGGASRTLLAKTQIPIFVSH